MRKLFVFILGVLLFLPLVSQEEKMMNYKAIKLMPLKVVDPFYSGLDLMYSKRIDNRGTQIGGRLIGSHKMDRFGFLVSFEKRKYNGDTYSGLNFSGCIMQYDGVTYQYSPMEVYVYDANLSLVYLDLNYKVGYEKRFNRFLIDAFAGIGLRVKAGSFEQYPGYVDVFGSDFWFDRKGLRLSIPCNVRIGYLI